MGEMKVLMVLIVKMWRALSLLSWVLCPGLGLFQCSKTQN
jgi:hypothetical protein